jgi:C4-dicarboxylate transporter DctQ subunit
MIALLRGLRVVERALLAAIMIGMSLLYFVNVVVRETSPRLATELAWIDEATLFALAWLVLVGLGLALERRRHIAMTVLSDALPPRLSAWLRRLINVCGLLFAALFAKFSFDFAAFVLRSGQTSPTLDVSMVVLYAALPIGFALLALRYLLELIGVENRFRTGGGAQEGR